MSISSVLAILNSVFFSAYLLQPRKRSLANLLLALLLIALTLRIVKSLTAVVFVDTSSILLAIGLGSMATIGPILYFYARNFINENSPRITMIHFVLSISMTLVSFSGNQLLIYIFYVSIVLQILVYIILATNVLIRHMLVGDVGKVLWIKVLIGAVFIIWLTMVMQLIFDNSQTYIATSTVAALFIYLLGFVGFNNGKLFLSKPESTIDLDSYKEISAKFHKILQEEKFFKTPKITLLKVARRMDIPPYLISRSINQVDGKSFPEIIKEYRLERIKSNLRDPSNKHISIEALAFETGFMSLSKFYDLFKKEIGQTPDQYRKAV